MVPVGRLLLSSLPKPMLCVTDTATQHLLKPAHKHVEVCCGAFRMHESAPCAFISADWGQQGKTKTCVYVGRTGLFDRRQSGGEINPAAPAAAWTGCEMGRDTCAGMAWHGDGFWGTHCGVEAV